MKNEILYFWVRASATDQMTISIANAWNKLKSYFCYLLKDDRSNSAGCVILFSMCRQFPLRIPKQGHELGKYGTSLVQGKSDDHMG